MKPITIFLVIAMIVITCFDSINSKYENVGYKTKWVCTKSHSVSGTRPQLIGKTIMAVPYTYDVCDSGYYDTIFVTKQIKK